MNFTLLASSQTNVEIDIKNNINGIIKKPEVE